MTPPPLSISPFVKMYNPSRKSKLMIQLLTSQKKNRVYLDIWVQFLHFIFHIEPVLLLVKFINKFNDALSFQNLKNVDIFNIYFMNDLYPSPFAHFWEVLPPLTKGEETMVYNTKTILKNIILPKSKYDLKTRYQVKTCYIST